MIEPTSAAAELTGPTSLREQVWRRLAPPLLLIAAIFVCSSRSSVPMPPIVDFDKVVHFAVYGFLATLICRVESGWRMAVLAVVLTSAYGGLDEWHQSFVPGRSSDVMDWLADSAGAAIAAFAYTRWHGYRRFLEMACGGAWWRKRAVSPE